MGVFCYNPHIMSWAQRRKATYTLGFFVIIAVIAFFILFSLFNKKATCFDGIQNQGETGIDCGGPCTILCRADYVDPTVLWVRSTKVLSSGTYSILAYATNANVGAGAYNVPYTFKIYDQNNILLYSGSGSTYVPPANDFAVFIDSININDKVPARIDFTFGSGYTWQKMDNTDAGIKLVSQQLTNTDTAPKLFATLQNTTLVPIKNIESIAILYDANNNAIAFSRTITDSINPNATANIVFTWPEVFSGTVYKIDIVSKSIPQ